MAIRLTKLPPGLVPPEGKPAKRSRRGRVPPVPLEKDIQRSVLQWLALVGVFAFRVNSGGMRWQDTKGKSRYMQFNTAKGCSDVLAILPDSRFGAFEIKRPGKVPTDDQKVFLARVQQAGGVAVFCTGVDDLRAKLKAEGYDL